ncbi:MAG TPA: hypothetical protein VK395_00495 [Gemmataceae bacterium]|nr:hypothetical protein [Gemmataceae bacterium]
MIKNSSVPTYRKHRQSGQATVTLPDGLGDRRDILLGKYGSAQTRQEYARIIGEWEANGRRLTHPTNLRDVSVNELMSAYWGFAKE